MPYLLCQVAMKIVDVAHEDPLEVDWGELCDPLVVPFQCLTC